MKKNPVMVAAGRQAAETRKLNAFHRSLAAKRAWATMRKNKIRGGRPPLASHVAGARGIQGRTAAYTKGLERVLGLSARLGKAVTALKNLG